MKLIKNIGFVAILFSYGQLLAQEGAFRIGFQASPGFDWMTTNELAISSVGANLTTSIGARAEYGLSDRFALATGLGIAFNRGGRLRHETGGNFFPDSRLSNNAYNSGLKPLPDGTRIKYNLQYVEVPIALKWHIADREPLSFFADAPIFTWGIALQRRGGINAGEIQTDKEDISHDVSPVNVMTGLGGGLEYDLGSKTALVAGLYFHRGLIDITSDKATFATPNPDDNPFDPNDDYLLHKEDSRAVINMLVIRLGILF